MRSIQHFFAVTAFLSTAAGAAVTGGLDIRPSWVTKTGEFHTENNVSLGIKTTTDLEVSLVHNFNANLFQPVVEEPGGLAPSAVDAYLKAGFGPLWKSDDSKVSLSYSPRVYLPVREAARASGQVTAVRNYFTLKQKLGSMVTLSAVEVPILHLYSQPGAVTGGTASANPIVENRVYLIGDVQLTEKLSLSIPVMFHATRYRPFLVGAKNDNAMGYFLWVNPELTYAVSDKLSVGLSYYSENLIAGDLGSTTLNDGFEQGVAQISLAASL